MQTKAFTVYLPEAVHEQLRTRAFMERTSINKLIVGMVTGTLPPLTATEEPPTCAGIAGPFVRPPRGVTKRRGAKAKKGGK